MLKDKEAEKRLNILFYVHQKLIFEIPKNLRLASAKWDKDSLCVYYYFDGEIDERDREALDEVETLYMCDFNPDELQHFNFKCIRVDEPIPIKCEGECFFARKEHYSSPIKLDNTL